MEGIQITLTQVSQTAQEVRRLNTQMSEQLQQMRMLMNQLENVWQSPSSQSIRAKFNAMTPIFDNYRDIVHSYAKYLDQTVASYEMVEQSIQQNANSFQ